MGMRAAQIHKTGALELAGNEDPNSEADNEGRYRIGGCFSMLDSKRRTAAGENVPARARKGIDF